MSCYHPHNSCQNNYSGCHHHSGCGNDAAYQYGCGHHHHDNCGYPPFPPFLPPWMQPGAQNRSGCNLYPQPICASTAQYSDAGTAQGATLVIHKIVLEPCGDPTCTPRTYNIRITGPSFPCGETFQLRAGSCTELDEPLVITGLEPGTYCIEEVTSCPHQYISTLTGPVCGQQVTVTNSYFPTVVTIVSRRRSCAIQRRRCC